MDRELMLARVRRWRDRAGRRVYPPSSAATIVKVWHLSRLGLGYVHIPKVATRSMQLALASCSAPDGQNVPDPRMHIPRAVRLYERRLVVSQVRSLSRHCWTFAFVRNPLDRLHSAWADKVVKLGRDIFDSHSHRISMDFPEFVERAASTSDERCDSHLRSQHRFVAFDGELVVDFVGRFERLSQDWQVVADRFGLPPLTQRNVSSRRDYRDAYTPELVRLASDRYRTDIELLGYSNEVAALAPK